MEKMASKSNTKNLTIASFNSILWAGDGGSCWQCWGQNLHSIENGIVRMINNSGRIKIKRQHSPFLPPQGNSWEGGGGDGHFFPDCMRVDNALTRTRQTHHRQLEVASFAGRYGSNGPLIPLLIEGGWPARPTDEWFHWKKLLWEEIWSGGE